MIQSLFVSIAKYASLLLSLWNRESSAVPYSDSYYPVFKASYNPANIAKDPQFFSNIDTCPLCRHHIFSKAISSQTSTAPSITYYNEFFYSTSTVEAYMEENGLKPLPFNDIPSLPRTCPDQYLSILDQYEEKHSLMITYYNTISYSNSNSLQCSFCGNIYHYSCVSTQFPSTTRLYRYKHLLLCQDCADSMFLRNSPMYSVHLSLFCLSQYGALSSEHTGE